MATAESSSIEVEIFDVTYRVRGYGDPAHLQEVAKFVDERMRTVAGHLATVDTTKIAVLAAMNIADECLRGQGGRYEGARGEITEKVLALAGALEEVLVDPAPAGAEDR